MRDVDQIIQLFQSLYPTVWVEQLRVSHPGDDDGIWFFEQPDSEFEVQIESHTGMCPFVIETDENGTRYTAKTVDEAVAILVKLLHLDGNS